MPDLTFQIEGASWASLTATPQIAFKLRLTNLNQGKPFTRSHCTARFNSR